MFYSLHLIEIKLQLGPTFKKKLSENEQKKCGFVYSSKFVDMQKLVDSPRGYPEIVFFCLYFIWFQPWNHWESFKMNKKGWKWLKKSSSTSFWVRAAPESWSKYTTIGYQKVWYSDVFGIQAGNQIVSVGVSFFQNLPSRRSSRNRRIAPRQSPTLKLSNQSAEEHSEKFFSDEESKIIF